MSYAHLPPISLLLFGIILTACSAPSEVSKTNFGLVELPLQNEIEGRTFRLENAQFRLLGQSEWLLDSADDPGSVLLTESLPAGQYSVELLDGWSLFELADGGQQPLEATLESINPAPFTVSEARTTQVTFRFAAKQVAEPASGSVELNFDVEWQARRSVFFSEIMKNPGAIPDSKGEWLELSNAGSEALPLMGCVITRDTQSFALSQPTVLEPGGSAVFANSDAPGFMPNEVYSGISLPNTSDFYLAFSCNGELLDEVWVNAKAFPNDAGKSLSLSPEHGSAAGNDEASAWCSANSPFDEDFGTPGSANPPCKPEQ